MFKGLAVSSDFLKHTLVLITGTVIAQLIPILLQPILRRIFSPEDFGALAVYLTLFSMLTIIFSLRYDSAIMLPKNTIISANILAITFIINTLFCILLFIVLLFFKNEIVSSINFPIHYADFLFLLPIACFAFSSYQSMNQWLIRKKAFQASSFNKITRRGIEGMVQTGTGLIKTSGGLFIGDLAGNISNACAGIYQIKRHGFDLKFISKNKMYYALKRYSDFPKYNLIPTLLSNAAYVLPFLFINKFYSTETVGYIDLSRLVLSIPLAFISTTISQVFFQQTTDKKNKGLSIKHDIWNILLILISIVVVEMIFIFLWGPSLFGFVFGKEYELSGQFSQVLVFSFALNFITSAFSTIFISFEKIRLNSIWQISYFFSICCLYFMKSVSISDFLRTYVVIEIIMHLTSIGMLYYIVSSYEKKLKNSNN